ncbi:MAG TPA: diaminopimelate decarboxylase [Candidatus Polarisedimenticolia bacterium]|nr:diaminopimelate decarboxylase [Candidatus Polarisedimenticolia bacterium]
MTRAPKSTRRSKSRRAVDPTEYTPGYAYRPVGLARARLHILHCEDVAVSRVADAVGTPAYVYSRASIESAYHRFDRAFGSLPHTLCYAMKANSNLMVLRILARLGSSFDVVSGGELDRLRRIGVAGRRVVFSGVGKTREEIRDALRYPGARIGRGGILLFNVESGAELEVLLSEAARHVAAGGERPSVAIRVNPDVLAGGHPHISTGHHHHKFGVDWLEARRLYLAHADSRVIVWRGISAHIGSQILSVAPYRRALARLASYVRDLARNGVPLRCVDIGGGLGIRYTDKSPIVPAAFARAISAIVRPLGCHLLIEPGRAIVGPAGVLLTRVLYVKETRGKTFVIVDAAMNDLIRPVLYDAVHPVTPAVCGAGLAEEKKLVDIVGPVCESGDFLARDCPLPPVQSGDLLAVWAAGAYGFVQSSNYNARRRPAEILVEGNRFRIARRRQTYDDLVRGESV